MIPDDVVMEHYEACKKCKDRLLIAKMTDCHFDWLDCPFDCPNDYEHWAKAERETVKCDGGKQ